MPKKKEKKKSLTNIDLLISITNPYMPFIKEFAYDELNKIIKKKLGDKLIGKALAQCIKPFMYLVFNCIIVPASHIIRNKELSLKESKKHEQYWEQILK